MKARQMAQRALDSLAVTDGSFAYIQDAHSFYHSAKPLLTYEQKSFGRFMLSDSGRGLLVADTVPGKSKSYPSYDFLSYNSISGWAFLEMGSSDSVVGNSTIEAENSCLYGSAIFTPCLILEDFLTLPDSNFMWLGIGAVDTITYAAAGNRIVQIILNPSGRVTSIGLFYPDDMKGDSFKRVDYLSYDAIGDYHYPSHVQEHQLGILMNDLAIHHEATQGDRLFLLSKIPPTYALPVPATKIPEKLTSTKYNKNIYFFELEQAESRVMLVNFKDFLLIAEAPLTTENGELIINKAHELFPKKPIKYFVFGHHHPWYLGGVRAFVHAGATILVQPMDSAYVKFIATNAHALRPDILETEPRVPMFEYFDSTKTISDGDIEMQILSLGAMSKHTDDYLIYYFPKYKLLFEDDLSGNVVGKPLHAADEREKGLYDGIKKYNLNVETIAQSWPDTPKYETIFPYAKLEEKVKMMK
jgi:hypothetical protein